MFQEFNWDNSLPSSFICGSTKINLHHTMLRECFKSTIGRIVYRLRFICGSTKLIFITLCYEIILFSSFFTIDFFFS
jgi:hypothetical protein